MPHTILALWAHPRSMSTATERLMRARGDLVAFHEPFMADYYMHRAPRPFAMLEAGGETWVEYAEMKARILAAAEAGPVFFKDMAYYSAGLLEADPVFARRLTHAFLIRDPRQAIASYWQKDPDMTREEIGIEAQWRMVQSLLGLGKPVLVIEAERVSEDPRGEMRRLWDFVDLVFIEHAFSWQPGEVPGDWAHVAGWHSEVIASEGIRPARKDGDERFRAALAAAPHLRDYLAHHLPFYEKLRALAGTALEQGGAQRPDRL